MIEKIKNRLTRYRDLRKCKNETNIIIDGFKINLGKDHNLTYTKKYNPMYDEFIPFLAQLTKKVSGGEKRYVIDIGANVGDTAAAMIKHTDCNILCIEPTEKFYNLCKQNINNFGKDYSNRCNVIQTYIAVDEAVNFGSNVINGTAIRDENIKGNNVPTYRIDTLLTKLAIDINDVELIKVDTDGYDSECILSIGDKLNDIAPLLYWENQVDKKDQYFKFNEMYDFLYKSGYNTFFVFDNFGNYLCQVNYLGLKEINNYLLRILNKKSARTFYYVDILAVKEDKEDKSKKIIKKYLDKFCVKD